LLRIKGEVTLRQGLGEAAEGCFREALSLAQEQGALFWELRVAVSLAHLRAAQRRPDEARQILAPVYAQFTEGFATTDLRAARALLDALTQ
jgi:predicted ATPase